MTDALLIAHLYDASSSLAPSHSLSEGSFHCLISIEWQLSQTKYVRRNLETSENAAQSLVNIFFIFKTVGNYVATVG